MSIPGGESEISDLKESIKAKDEDFETIKTSYGETSPKAAKETKIEYIDGEVGKTVELNAEKVNENLANMMVETKKAEDELEKTLYGGLFSKARKWFAENVSERMLGMKIEDFRVIKGAVKGVGGLGGFLFGLGTLNPLIAAIGAKTAFDGIVESIKYLHEGKYIRAMRSAVCEKFKVIDEMSELRNQIKTEVGPTGDLREVSQQVDWNGGQESINNVLRNLMTRTKDIDKEVKDNFPTLKKLEKIYGITRFVGGILVSLGAAGWVAALKEGAKVAAQATTQQALQRGIIEGKPFGPFDFDKYNKAHELVQYNKDMYFIYNQGDIIAKNANGGWKLFANVAEAKAAGFNDSTIQAIHSLGSGTHTLAGGAKLTILEKGGQLMHAINFAPAANASISSASTASSSIWELISRYGGALAYTAISGTLEGKTAKAKIEAEKEATPSLATFGLEPTSFSKNKELQEKLYKNLSNNDVFTTNIGTSKKYYVVTEKLAGDRIKYRQIDPLTGDFMIDPTTGNPFPELEDDKNTVFPPASINAIEKNSKNFNELKTEIEEKNKTLWNQWLTDNDIQVGYILSIDNSSAVFKNSKNKNLEINKDYKIEEIKPEKGQILLTREVIRNHRKVKEKNLISLSALKLVLDGSNADKIFIGEEIAPAPNQPGSATNIPKPLYLDILERRVNEDDSTMPDDLAEFRKMRKALWSYDNAGRTEYWKIVKQNKAQKMFFVKKYNASGNPITPPETEWKNAADFIEDAEFVSY